MRSIGIFVGALVVTMGCQEDLTGGPLDTGELDDVGALPEAGADMGTPDAEVAGDADAGGLSDAGTSGKSLRIWASPGLAVSGCLAQDWSFAAFGGDPPYAWRRVRGTWPSEARLVGSSSVTAHLRMSRAEPGVYQFTLGVVDGGGREARLDVVRTVRSGPEWEALVETEPSQSTLRAVDLCGSVEDRVLSNDVTSRIDRRGPHLLWEEGGRFFHVDLTGDTPTPEWIEAATGPFLGFAVLSREGHLAFGEVATATVTQFLLVEGSDPGRSFRYRAPGVARFLSANDLEPARLLFGGVATDSQPYVSVVSFEDSDAEPVVDVVRLSPVAPGEMTWLDADWLVEERGEDLVVRRFDEADTLATIETAGIRGVSPNLDRLLKIDRTSGSVELWDRAGVTFERTGSTSSGSSSVWVRVGWSRGGGLGLAEGASGGVLALPVFHDGSFLERALGGDRPRAAADAALVLLRRDDTPSLLDLASGRTVDFDVELPPVFSVVVIPSGRYLLARERGELVILDTASGQVALRAPSSGGLNFATRAGIAGGSSGLAWRLDPSGRIVTRTVQGEWVLDPGG